MNSNTALDIIRRHSKPYHDKLDKIGLSKAVYNGHLPTDIYTNWLMTTRDMLEGISILDQSSGVPNRLAHYISLDTESLDDDLKKLNSSSNSPYDLPQISDPSLWVVPIYTYLGSVHGIRMIYKFIQKQTEYLPTAFIEERIQKAHLWKEFVTSIDEYSSQFDSTTLSQYTEDFWKILYERNLQQFA